MARKGILPRRKRGRASLLPTAGDNNQVIPPNNPTNTTMARNKSDQENRTDSPPLNEPQFFFGSYKFPDLPDLKQELI